ncbi:MAG: hypothetical protein ABSC37_06435 [Xanthobacteraceae bacterium]
MAGEIAKFTGRPEPSLAPERGAEPRTNASPRRPRTPFPEFADNKAAPGLQHTGNFPKNGSRVFDEAKNGYCRHDVELFSGEREVLRHRYLKDNIHAVLLSPPPGRINHCRRGINARYDRAAFDKSEGKLSVATAHVQDSGGIALI